MPSKSASSKTGQPIQPDPNVSPDPLGGELERLRDILIGSHARTVSERLDHLEARTVELSNEFAGDLKEEIKHTRQDHDSQLRATRQELINTFTSEIAALRKELQEQAKRSQKELQEHAERSQKELQATNDRLQKLAAENQKLAAEQSANLRAAQTDLKLQIESQTRDLTARMEQRDDTLSQELRQLAAKIEEKKVARDELAQLLQDLARQIAKS
jgi:hypothetical protein